MTDNILIFRTSIEKRREIKKIEKLFTQYPQIHVWNVDFEDWEKILRIECQGITYLIPLMLFSLFSLSGSTSFDAKISRIIFP